MELWGRKDFIQIDFKDGNFQTVCVTKEMGLNANGDEAVYFDVMQQFGNSLEECIKFTIGAMSAIRLFKDAVYKPVDYIEIIYTKEAKKQILSKKYKVAEYIYPDLKQMKGAWRLLLH